MHRFLHPTTDYEHNELVLYLQVLPQGLYIGGAMAFVDVFMVRLGAPNWLVSLGTSLPALVQMLTVLPLGALIQRRRRLLHDFNLTRVVGRGFYSLMALAPFLPPALAPVAIVVLRTLSALPGAAQSVCFGTVMGKATTPERRARMFSTRWGLMRVSMAGVGFAVGIWLESVAFPLNYQVLFASSVLIGAATAYALSKLRLAPDPPVSEEQQERVRLRAIPDVLRRIPRFRNYVLARLVLQLGISLSISVIPIYRVRELGASDGWLGALLTIQNVVQIVAYAGLSRLLRKKRFRQKLWLSAVGIALFPLTTALATHPTMLVIPAVLGGLFASALNVFLMDELMAVTPEDERPILVSINTFVTAMVGFGAPMLGTAIADATTLQVALYLSAALRAMGGITYWWLSRKRTISGVQTV